MTKFLIFFLFSFPCSLQIVSLREREVSFFSSSTCGNAEKEGSSYSRTNLSEFNFLKKKNNSQGIRAAFIATAAAGGKFGTGKIRHQSRFPPLFSRHASIYEYLTLVARP